MKGGSINIYLPEKEIFSCNSHGRMEKFIFDVKVDAAKIKTQAKQINVLETKVNDD